MDDALRKEIVVPKMATAFDNALRDGKHPAQAWGEAYEAAKGYYVDGDDEVTFHWMEIKFLWRRARIELTIDWRLHRFEWSWHWMRRGDAT